VLLVSDGENISTTNFLRRIGELSERTAWLVAAPVWARLINKQYLAQRLCESPRLDISKSLELWGWTLPFSVELGQCHAVESFLEQQVK